METNKTRNKYINNKYWEHTRIIRTEEIRQIIEYLPPAPARILEVGAGNGLQSSLLAAFGYEVFSIDIKSHDKNIFYNVSEYDGKTIPFPDEDFDIVFTSSALEHFVDIDGMEKEIFRVLKPTGLAVHLVPTASWRLWTTLTYYPALPWIIKGAFGQLTEDKPYNNTGNNSSTAQHNKAVTSSSKINIKRIVKWLCTLLMSPRHGERGNRFSEVFYFSHSWWSKHFIRNGFRIIVNKPIKILFSGNALLGLYLPLSIRKRLAPLLGSCSSLYVLCKNDDLR